MTDSSSPAAPSFHGDRPIGPEDKDELGFKPVAERVAAALSDQAAERGLVLAVEGRWGSGKSSLVNLIAASLGALTGDKSCKVVRFEPWLIGDRDALLGQLFDEISRAIQEIEDQARGGPDAAETAKTLADQLREFGSRLSGPAKVVRLAGALGLPAAGPIADLMEKAAEAANANQPDDSLAQLKANLDEALGKLGQRLVVIIDDLDRLEPAEVGEVLRLVRAVADFPNVVYVLCYDPDVVGSNVEQAIGVRSGKSFLEKIVQVSVSVPLPEAFDLRRWFSRELAKFADCNSEDAAQRLISVIDLEGGGRLHTPRDVNRTLNAIRLLWPSVRGKIDLSDFVWLQLIRAHNPSLYRWVENYIREMAAVADGARLSDEGKRLLFEDLEAALQTDRARFEDVRRWFGRILPGIDMAWRRDPDSTRIPIGETPKSDDVRSAIEGRRLASPLHYRLFFSLEFPSGALTDEEFLAALNESDVSVEAAVAVFEKLVEASRPQGGTKADLFIERLRGAPGDSVEGELAINLSNALAFGLDTAAKRGGRADWGQFPSWQSGTSLFKSLVRKFPKRKRRAAIRKMFEQGSALGWLTSIFRSEVFAHGRHGTRAAPDDERMLKPRELDDVTDVMLRRYEDAGSQLIETPSLTSALFAWGQASEFDKPKAWFEEQTRSDEGLVAVLEAMRSWRALNGVVQYPLTRENLQHFTDYDALKQRVVSLNQQGNMRDKTAPLVSAFELADD